MYEQLRKLFAQTLSVGVGRFWGGFPSLEKWPFLKGKRPILTRNILGRLIFYHDWCWRVGGAVPAKTSTGNTFPRKYRWDFPEIICQYFRRTSETPTTTASQKSIAIHIQFVLQHASNLYCNSLAATELSEKGNTSVLLPFVSQCASHCIAVLWGNLGGSLKTLTSLNKESSPFS